MPEVSIIVPNYNHGRFLEERLESIFSQTFQDFEVILLDDCSTDNSVEILQKYASHSKVKGLYINESNSCSPFKQWFKGISLAEGKYIWIAESDDIADKDFLAVLVPVLEANSRLALAYCQSKIINENSDVIGEYSNYSCSCPERWKRDFTNSGMSEISSFLLHINTIPNASAVLVRKSVLDNITPPANQNTMGDWYIWIKILSRGDLFYTAKPLNYFRQSSQSTRQDCPFEGKQARVFQAIELMEQLAQEKILCSENYRKAMLCRLDSWTFECFSAQAPFNNLFYVLKRFPALKKYAPQLLLDYVRHKLHLRSRFRLKKYTVFSYGRKPELSNSLIEENMSGLSIYIVSAVNNFEMYARCVRGNEFLKAYNFKCYDNTAENIGIAERYNDFIDSNITSDSDFWVIFCHQDFGFEEDPGPKLAKLPLDCIYGPIGVNIRLGASAWPPKIFRRKVTEGQFKQGHNNTDFEVIGNYLTAPKTVIACDCCCLIVHSSLINRYQLRFDPACKFHLYAEDFEVTARKKYNIPVKAVQLACYHQGIGNYSDPQFFATLEYLKTKHRIRKLYSTNPYC